MSADKITYGLITVEVPASCPDAVLFGTIVTDTFIEHFATPERAGLCRAAWQETQSVPEPFASNDKAGIHYRNALLALSPDAQTWERFEDDLNRRFADYNDDGSDKTPAIKDWQPHWLRFAA